VSRIDAVALADCSMVRLHVSAINTNFPRKYSSGELDGH